MEQWALYFLQACRYSSAWDRSHGFYLLSLPTPAHLFLFVFTVPPHGDPKCLFFCFLMAFCPREIWIKVPILYPFPHLPGLLGSCLSQSVIQKNQKNLLHKISCKKIQKMILRKTLGHIFWLKLMLCGTFHVLRRGHVEADVGWPQRKDWTLCCRCCLWPCRGPVIAICDITKRLISQVHVVALKGGARKTWNGWIFSGESELAR